LRGPRRRRRPPPVPRPPPLLRRNARRNAQGSHGMRIALTLGAKPLHEDGRPSPIVHQLATREPRTRTHETRNPAPTLKAETRDGCGGLPRPASGVPLLDCPASPIPRSELSRATPMWLHRASQVRPRAPFDRRARPLRTDGVAPPFSCSRPRARRRGGRCARPRSVASPVLMDCETC
jgi:hypothetical protein